MISRTLASGRSLAEKCSLVLCNSPFNDNVNLLVSLLPILLLRARLSLLEPFREFVSLLLDCLPLFAIGHEGVILLALVLVLELILPDFLLFALFVQPVAELLSGLVLLNRALRPQFVFVALARVVVVLLRSRISR